MSCFGVGTISKQTEKHTGMLHHAHTVAKHNYSPRPSKPSRNVSTAFFQMPTTVCFTMA